MEETRDPAHLYKYRSTNLPQGKYTERIITDHELYFARPSEFNDPFDCSPIASLEATDQEFSEYLNDLYKRRMPHLSRSDRRASVKAALNDRRRNHRSVAANELLARSLTEVVELAGVLSLSARPDHVLMWSHYADSHRGICLRFKSTSTTPYFGRSQRVAYTKERPKFNLILDDPSVQADKALLTKADFWAYEEEWRIVEHDHGPGVHKFPPQLLDGIILGARISDVDKNRYMGLVKNYGSPVELMQAKFSATEFRVEIHSLEI